MAKRYFTFESLQGVSGYLKPGGTLGKHHATIVPQGDTIVVVGSAKGRVTLKAGDTLGYDIGKVWLVPHPDSYRDPIRRVLALAKISQRLLEYTDEPVRYSVSYGRTLPSSSADTERGEGIRAVLGEHQSREVPETRWDGPEEGEYLGSFSFEREITGGDAIVVTQVASFEAATLSRRRKVSRVVVRPKTDKVKVADWLEEMFDVGKARERRLTEKQDAKEAFEADYATGARIFEEVARFFDTDLLKEVLAEATFPYREDRSLTEQIRTFFSFDWDWQRSLGQEEDKQKRRALQPRFNKAIGFWCEGDWPLTSTCWYVEPRRPRDGGARPEAVVTLAGVEYTVQTQSTYVPKDVVDGHGAAAGTYHTREIVVGLYRTGRLQRWLDSLKEQPAS